MKKIKIYAIGKIKDDYLKVGINQYLTRLSKYADVEIIELKDEPIKNESDPTEIIKAKNLECERVLTRIKNTDYLYALDPNGVQLKSEEFATHLNNKFDNESSSIAFVIGGSYGLSDEIKARSNYKLSFSKMTFTHQMSRLILLEQIYRAFKINNNETYHK